MPQAYSDDVRTKFLDAYACGRGSLEKLACLFGVSYGYAKKIRRQQLQTGERKRQLQSRHGPAGLLTAEIKQYLRVAVARQADITLAELKQQLQQAHRIQISPSRLWYWLRGLGLRHKKNAARPGTGTRREPMASPDMVGSARRGRSRLPGVSR
jgi:transposase